MGTEVWEYRQGSPALKVAEVVEVMVRNSFSHWGEEEGGLCETKKGK